MLRVFHPALPCTHCWSERQVELVVGFNGVGGAKDLEVMGLGLGVFSLVGWWPI